MGRVTNDELLLLGGAGRSLKRRIPGSEILRNQLKSVADAEQNFRWGDTIRDKPRY
jgi:hypothetical protein